MQTIRQTILNSYKKCAYKCLLEWGEVGEVGKYEEEQNVGNKYSNCGIALHEVMEVAGQDLMRGVIPNLERMKADMEQKFYEVPDEMFDDGEDREKWFESLIEQIEWLHEQTCHSTSVIDVEKTFSIEDMFTDMPKFTGCIDRVEGNLEAKDVSLIDYKTGKVYTKNELNDNIQACIYSLAFFREYGFLPKEFIFYFSKHKKIKKIIITLDFINRVSADIIRIVAEMKANHYEPNCASLFFCRNFCEFYNECPRHKRVKKEGWEALGE